VRVLHPSQPFDAISRPWFVRPDPRPNAHLRLYAFGWSGAGPSAYAPWAHALPEYVELVAIQLPGRADRRTEPPATDLVSLAAAIVNGLSAEPAGQRMFFGHSMGALLAYEVCQQLAGGGGEPESLIVSGSRAPGVPPALTLHDRSDDELSEVLYDLGGMSRAKIADPGFRERILPLIRADLTACETYRPFRRRPLNNRLCAWAGDHDWFAPSDVVAAWSSTPAADFDFRTFPGGHFFVRDSYEVFAGLLAELELVMYMSPKHRFLEAEAVG
jgi:surfactin synthase thioesterase subunit